MLVMLQVLLGGYDYEKAATPACPGIAYGSPIDVWSAAAVWAEVRVIICVPTYTYYTK
jgi:hypothetical protein